MTNRTQTFITVPKRFRPPAVLTGLAAPGVMLSRLQIGALAGLVHAAVAYHAHEGHFGPASPGGRNGAEHYKHDAVASYLAQHSKAKVTWTAARLAEVLAIKVQGRGRSGPRPPIGRRTLTP